MTQTSHPWAAAIADTKLNRADADAAQRVRAQTARAELEHAVTTEGMAQDARRTIGP